MGISGSFSERRMAARYAFDLHTQPQLGAVIEGLSVPVTVRNISACGISLVLSRRVDLPTVITVRLHHLNRGFTCIVPVKVVYLLEHPGGDFILGCTFAQPLGETELRGLL